MFLSFLVAVCSIVDLVGFDVVAILKFLWLAATDNAVGDATGDVAGFTAVDVAVDVVVDVAVGSVSKLVS